MNFQHSDSERFKLNDAARRAIESHGKSMDSLDLETRRMREEEHTGVELTGAELAVVKKVIFDWMNAAENEEQELEQSLRDRTAANTDSADNRVRELKQTLHFLRHNLAEKLFEERDNTKNSDIADDSG